jgi:hypothetical protein
VTAPVVLRVRADALSDAAGALRKLHDGDADALVIESLFDVDAAEATEARLLAGRPEEWLLTDRDPRVRIRMIGALISPSSKNPRGPDPEDWLAAAESTKQAVNEAFVGDWFGVLEEALSTVSGLPVRTAVSSDGRMGVPTSIRGLPPGGGFAPHCEAGYVRIAGYDVLRERLCLDRKMGYFLQVAPAEQGGKLVIYDLGWDPEHRPFDDRPAQIVESIDHTIVLLRAGDLVVLNAGPVYHQVTEVEGGRTRWTMGGFAAYSQDGATFEYWS